MRSPRLRLARLRLARLRLGWTALLLTAALLAGCSGSGRPGAGAGAAILSPGAAPSSLSAVGGGPVTTTVVAITQKGPAAEGTTVKATASCPAGTQLVGGGASTLLVNGRQPPSSFHTNGTFPVSGAASWSAVGATGGQVVLGGATTALAVCAALPGASFQVPTASTPGPGGIAALAKSTVACPAGSVLIGGGGYAQSSSSAPSLHLIASYPSTADSTPAAPASTPVAWTAVADSGGRGGKGITTVAYALCATGTPLAMQVAVSTASGPDSPTTSKTATAACPAGTSLLGGGVRSGVASGAPPQQGIHLTGSFPSSVNGVMVTGRGGLPVAWTARAETGGQAAPHIQTSAFALCAAAIGG